jgi:hypothetical protein
MSNKSLIKVVALAVTILNLTGCAKVFTSQGDKPVKSPCEVCKKTPFYVNGKRV